MAAYSSPFSYNTEIRCGSYNYLLENQQHLSISLHNKKNDCFTVYRLPKSCVPHIGKMILDNRRSFRILSRNRYSLVHSVTQLNVSSLAISYIVLANLYKLTRGFPGTLHSPSTNPSTLGRLICVGLPYRKKEILKYFG